MTKPSLDLDEAKESLSVVAKRLRNKGFSAAAKELEHCREKLDDPVYNLSAIVHQIAHGRIEALLYDRRGDWDKKDVMDLRQNVQDALIKAVQDYGHKDFRPKQEGS